MRLENKVALITGTRPDNIGGAIARSFAIEGAHVIAAALHLDNATRTSNEVKKLNKNDKGFAIQVDVRKEDEVERMVKQVIKAFGRIDILVNSHGIVRVIPLTEMLEEDWDDIMGVNAKGQFLCCKHVAREMIKQKSGKIINLASIAAKRGIKFLSAYCASKFATEAITQSLAQELAPYNIRVNAVCPGDVDTEMFRGSHREFAKLRGLPYEEIRKEALTHNLIGRFEKPEDVAPLVVYLASDESDYMTGVSIDISGGILYPPSQAIEEK